MNSPREHIETAGVTLRPEELRDRFAVTRARSEDFVLSLEPEDCVVQSMPDASPTRWHLAHTTWFFETFVLGRTRSDYQPYHPAYERLFNSYYNSVGTQFPRSHRGLLSRPTVREVLEYRAHVNRGVLEWLEQDQLRPDLVEITELGLSHEEQHLELMYTDIKHVLFQNPLQPTYRSCSLPDPKSTATLGWTEIPEGLYPLGHTGTGFHFDNEEPRHQAFLVGGSLANRLITCGEYLDFIEDGGYRRPEFWLSEGWQQVQEDGWEAPLYWTARDGNRFIFSLSGERSLRLEEPVCHVSYFEADAFARWSGARLPTEAEWETAASSESPRGNLLEEGHQHPVSYGPVEEGHAAQLFGDVWEWTSSPYSAYPGYEPAQGALGEYNGKFMVNQYVLRGGSCVTPKAHIRPTYRNFLPAHARWQFSGIRLAR